ncbi:efflux RND transporter periplasmic adaptor subunit [bacterium]|nr:efflux RND transporter periplasmic adaptor subunit [bacterium]
MVAFMHRGGASMHGGSFHKRSGSQTPETNMPFIAPAQPPYSSFVAGAGIVEASSENISIGTPIAGVVAEINAQVGSRVKKGDPLFSIDSRATRAELAVRRAAVQVAEAQCANARSLLDRAASLGDARVISQEELDNRRYALQIAEAQLAQARANVQSTETDLDRMTIRAPMDGEVLQLNTHLGEFAPANDVNPPAILFGDIQTLWIRVDVDEYDAWRVRAGAPAMGFLRGNKDIKKSLQFVRIEPYVVPKRSLTGDSMERVDTRVLQIVYSFRADDLPIHVGQLMDVFIDASQNDLAAARNIRP